ncbi:MAG: hypothetical protein AAF337_08780 [Pseudomonadota bacterium]
MTRALKRCAIGAVLGISAVLSACGEEEANTSDASTVADISPSAPAPDTLVTMVDTHVICVIRDSNNEIYYVSDAALVSSEEGTLADTTSISADYEAFIKSRYNVGDTPSQAECERAQSDETADALLTRVTKAVNDAGGFVTSVEYSFAPS